MKAHQLDNSVINLLAAAAGLALAAVVKIAFAPQEEPELDATDHLLRDPRNAARLMSAIEEDKMAQMRRAATDPLYLDDMQEVNDDFAFADAENL